MKVVIFSIFCFIFFAVRTLGSDSTSSVKCITIERSNHLWRNLDTLPTNVAEKSQINSIIRSSPNPANDEITFQFDDIAITDQIIVEDLRGKRIKTFPHTNGLHIIEVIWDSKDDFGQLVPAGVYFFKIFSQNKLFSHKFIIAND